MSPDVLDLRDTAERSVDEVGGKAKGLGRLLAAGLPVPPGFCIAVGAFADPGPAGAGDGAIGLRRPAVESVCAAWAGMPRPHGVAVRSSATTEDAATGSAAGQYETVLGVLDAASLLAAVERCWRSQWSDRARAYHGRAGVAPATVAMAVVVQAMVRPDWAGVAFSAEGPAPDDDQGVLVEAVPGRGDALVEGLIEPERVVLSRHPPYPVALRVPAPGDRADPLSEDRLREVAGAALAAEQLLGAPQDVEWAVDADGLHLLQARPITARVPRPEPPVDWVGGPPTARWARMSICDSWLAEPLSPLFASTLFPRLVDRWATNWGGSPAARRRNPLLPDPMHGTVNGYAYLRFDFPLSRHPLRTLRLIARWLRFHLSPVERQWRERVRPDLEAGVAATATDDLSGLAPTEVLARVNRIEELSSRYWAVIGGLAWHWNASEWLLTALLRRVPAWRRLGLSAGTLLAGEDRYARRAEQLLGRIAAAPPGAEAELVAAYLEEYGHLVYNLDVAEPTPRDDPALLRATVAARRAGNAVATSDPGGRTPTDPSRAAIARAVSRRPFGPLLGRVLRWAEHWSGIRDAALHAFTLGWPFLRAGYRELGRRMVAEGILDAADDVYHLTGDELHRWVAGRADRQVTANWREQVAERRRRRERQRRLSPPDVVPEDARISLFGADITALALFGVAPGGASGAPDLTGSAVSPGIRTGRARVLHDAADAGLLKPGEVMVVRHLTPAWAPLLSLAGAVVADVGGALSHGSVVAREYGVPAVLGVKHATSRLRSGDLVTVDGDAGTVTQSPDP